VWRKLIADTETPVSAALKLIEADRGDFLLESVEGGAVRGRYSLIGLAPDLVFRAEGDRPRSTANGRPTAAAFRAARGDGALTGCARWSECRADRWIPRFRRARLPCRLFRL
jgi:anthranilate synthase component 1